VLTRICDDTTDGQPPRISVVIPVLDGGGLLNELLDTLERQQVAGGFEVLAVDSGSTDGSLEHLRARTIRLYAVRREEFGHGRTRNAALALARGRRLILLTQDAVPDRPDFLEQLAQPLDADPCLAGTYGRQLPHPDTDPLLRARLDRWTPPGEDRRQSSLTREAFAALTPGERIRRCRFDNVASCLRPAVWRKFPFPEVAFGEDTVWAKTVLLAGHDLLYRPSAAVRHAHHAGPHATFTRERQAHAMLAREFGLTTVPSLPAGLLAWCFGWPGDLRTLVGSGTAAHDVPRLLARGGLRRAAEITGQYLGARKDGG